MTSSERCDEKRKSFMYNIRIVEFVLMETGMILSDSFNLASSPDGLSALKLLTALFSLCEY